MVKGPKAILSHAIADALAEYFEVDPKAIESNLITDAKIVLRNAKLREQEIHSNQTVATVTGSVDKVSFTWKWTVPSESKTKNATDAGWVKDAVLTIKGLRFKTQLACDEGEAETEGATKTRVEHILAEHAQTGGVSEEKSTLDKEPEMKKEKEGGIKDYMRRQVQNIIDSLTLDVVDFEFIIEIPDTKVQERTIAIIVGGKAVQIRREASDKYLEQRLMIASFFASVVVSTEEASSKSLKQVTYPLLEPLSYSATVTRLSGRSFNGMGTGLKVIGRPIATSVENLLATGTDKGVVLYAGAVQLQALARLTSMVLAPTDDGNAKTCAAEEDGSFHIDVAGEPNPEGIDKVTVCQSDEEDTKQDQEVEEQTNVTIPSMFEIPISAVSLVIMEDTTIVVSNVKVTYKADGTLLNVEARRFDLGSKSESEEAGALCSISGIRGRMRPFMVLEMDVVETLYVPGVIDLTKELRSPSIAMGSDTLSVDFASVEATVPDRNGNKKKEAASLRSDTIKTAQTNNIAESTIQEAATKEDSSATSKHVAFQENDKGTSSSPTNVMAPFPIRISLQELKLKKARDNSLMSLQDLTVTFKPERTPVVGTAVAVHLGEFKNELLQFRNTNVSALVPRDQPDVTRDFKLDAESVHVHAGHSSEEWSEKFEPPEAVKERRSKTGPQKMPFAEVTSLNIQIAYKGTGVALKETAVVMQPFSGKAETTSNDLLFYYTRACLSRVPGFISNAEVLGVNVVDRTATTYGAWGMAGMGGAFGGVTAVATIDAVRGVLAVGKKSRDATSDDRWKPGDFVRGALHTPRAISKAGAQRRGKEGEAQDGNVTADFAVGAACGAGEYVGGNKARLGAAGAAGMGVIYGTLFGGPIGGIVGGVLAGVAAGKAIEAVEESVSDMASEKIEGDLIEAKINDP